MLVVGPKEAETDSVGVRSRDAGELGAMSRELAADTAVEAACGRDAVDVTAKRASPALTTV